MGPINNKLAQPAWRAGQSRAQTPMRSAINPHKSEVGWHGLRGILKILQSKDYTWAEWTWGICYFLTTALQANRLCASCKVILRYMLLGTSSYYQQGQSKFKRLTNEAHAVGLSTENRHCFVFKTVLSMVCMQRQITGAIYRNVW